MQRCLSQKIIRKDFLAKEIQTVGGVDISYCGDVSIGAITVFNYRDLELLETQVAVRPLRMPYVPTLLSFREIPPAVTAIQQLKVQPDVFLVDAQGLAHPYRCGFASHLGLVLSKPTIGVAKSRLIGQPTEVNGRMILVDKGEIVGELVRIKPDIKPVYVSVGHMISLETAVQVVRHCSRSKIPEPLLQAHKLATKTRLELAEKIK
jgi:deoxyribonuclease V